MKLIIVILVLIGILNIPVQSQIALSGLLNIYDFIVVGSGSSGSIITDRLSEKGYSVLVLEAGKNSLGAFGGNDVVGTKGTLDPATFEYTPQKTLTKYDVPLYWQASAIVGPRWPIAGAGVAKVVGGSGVHNGMVFQRGKQSDYNSWNVPDWNWTTISPYLNKLETIMDSHLLSSPIHGHSGRIKVGSRPFDIEGANFLASCNASGLPFNDDFQQDYRDGCGYFQFNIDDKGERSSSCHEYLVRAVARPNVKLVANAQVTRIRWRLNLLTLKYEAAGVEFVMNGDSSTLYYASVFKEVILAAGTLNSPKILMQSGVGDSATLAQYSMHIPNVIKNLPGVGRNLQNHFICFTVYQYNDTTFSRPTLYDLFGLDLQYQTTGTGMFATPGYSVGVWLRPNATGGEAENVMIVQPGVIGSSTPFKSMTLGVSISMPQPNNHYLGLSTNTSGSRTDFFLRPTKLNFTLLNKDADVQTLVRGIKESRRIMSFPPMNQYVSPVLPPGSTDADIEAYVRAATSAHEHWVGTCKMGTTSDPNAVVDPKLKVIGVNGVRIVDASVIPILPHSLLHATVMAVAEKASDLILADYALY